eukprot:CAMPEP_0167762118 /NCGR_PEP_ID=MMETSP0110_2-20121227/12566_1 /TAXON_ID=629695 /ORGANISM="Gymnochlora sp., Strain CCMP2014" /LENGTH=66 /DNA_ID=CAMNT_0007648909 /DNA_START=41 /DNA_END=241 /DNA_ORIENTATION=-
MEAEGAVAEAAAERGEGVPHRPYVTGRTHDLSGESSGEESNGGFDRGGRGFEADGDIPGELLGAEW